MKTNTIKWRIFKYNIIIIIMLIAIVAVVFNVAIRVYIENDILLQLNRISSKIEDAALKKGPVFFKDDRRIPPPFLSRESREDDKEYNAAFRYYFLLDRSIREPLSVLNANYLLLDSSKEVINPLPKEYSNISDELLERITGEVKKLKEPMESSYLNFTLSGIEYMAMAAPVSDRNSFGLGWIVIYSSLQQIHNLQAAINIILLTILAVSALITVIVSSILSRKVSSPFSSLNQHVRDIAEIKFGRKIQDQVYDELQELVNNFNTMSEKLETYDKAQKTFLQNASHEFRTPLMSIQSYAEGIKYGVTDGTASADIIIDESKRLTQLVENLLYLSRLDAIEEGYSFSKLSLNYIISSSIERMNIIAAKNGISFDVSLPEEELSIDGDEEQITRAISNIISNCIRYADSTVTISCKLSEEKMACIIIADDGPGFEPDELPNIFERFYKGAKGNFGLGLAISKNVIEKHNGKITAHNSDKGAAFVIKLPLA